MFLRAITAHTISQIPMKTSQTPATTASTAIEPKDQAITTMPAIQFAVAAKSLLRHEGMLAALSVPPIADD
jgi:hypothetical protein